MKYIILFVFLISHLLLSSQNDYNKVIVKDTSLYDNDFITYWSYLKSYGVYISNDSIIVGGNREDVIIIPTDLPLKQEVKYETTKGDTNYLLIVNRQNYTNVCFSIIGTNNNDTVFERNNVAILEPSFHLGAEGVYEKSEDEIYGMNDYNITNHGKHKLLIPVGTIEVINYYEPQKYGEIVLVLLFNKIE